MRTLITLVFTLLFSAYTLSAADYYWVGGSGNWSDISHWATTTNGAITHNQAPTANDDVYFDFNSFSAPGQVVTLNNDIIFCRSMSWNGVANNPSFLGDENVTINVFGSWSLDPNMNFDFSGRVLFTGTQAGNMVSFGTHNAGQDITFSGTGDWTLSSDITVDSAFIFTEGTLNTNSQNVDCLYFDARTTNTRTLDLGFSIFTIRGGTIDPFNGTYPPGVTQPMYINATNLSMDGGGSTFILINPIVDIWLEGTGDINFNRVILSSPMGNSKIIPYDPLGLNTQPNMNYEELHLFHSTLLEGSPQITGLILTPGQRYSFASGETFSFGYIEALGNCSSSITMQNTGGNLPVFFNSDNNITLNFVALRGITASGPGNFTANNSIDLGNNTNWTINPRTPDDFFWIGNSGDWNDPAHWSFSSGGPSSGCIPSAVDDVYFDQNAFSLAGQSVRINIENAYCHSMDWTGVTNMPDLTGPAGNSLFITASLTFNPAMVHSFEGDYHFESEEMGNTLTTAGHPFNNDLFFTGINGEWIFQDAIYVYQHLFFESGTLRTNDQDVEVNSFYSEDAFSRSMFLGNSHFVLDDHSIAGEVQWNLNGLDLTFDAASSTIETRGQFSGLVLTSGTGVAYNNILFNTFEGRLFSVIDPPNTPVQIDSIIYNQSGSINGDHIVQYWQMAAGQTYTFTFDALQTITELNASGNCGSGFTRIEVTQPAYTTSFDIANDHTFNALSLQGIQQIGSGVLQANNSIDAGYNQGWNFTNATGRNLFWVGGDGDWNDQAHWSLSSGGPGGECIPTPVDDVTFDANAFPFANAVVNNALNNHAYCRNMTWTADVANQPIFNVNNTNIYGSIDIQANMDWGGLSLFFNGTDNHTIASTVALENLFFESDGTYTLTSDLEAWDIRQYLGTFNTNSFNITAYRYVCDGLDNPKQLILGSSHLLLTDGSPSEFGASFHVFSEGLVLDAGQSLIEMSHPNAGMRSTYPLTFNNVLFSNPQGNAYLIAENAIYNHVHFHGNGDLRGNMDTDTLICSPGKSYVFDANEIQRIHEYWYILGNNCTPISLSSSIIGSLASVYMPPASTLQADFIQMQYMQGIGGANFFAGSHSTDINNSNVEWIFENAPDFIDVGFLGEDLALCTANPVTLDAYHFTSTETYLWQDGSTDTTLVVDQSGTYFVEVTFGDNCAIRDTIEVLAAQDFEVDIQDDPSFCDGETLTLDADIGVNGATYLWQDGSTEPTLAINTSGEYTVTVDVGGCTAMDATTASVDFYPNLDLGVDFSLCDGDDFNLAANVVAQTYLWQDGSTNDFFAGNTPGIYWLEAANGQCASRDSIEISYVTSENINLGADTLLCDQSSFMLSLNIPNSTFEWQDGSTLNTFTAIQSGEYWVEVTSQGCSARDSISLVFQNNPSIDIADEIMACQGDLIELNGPASADSYLWSDGDMDANFSSNMAGNYHLDATFGTCIVRKSFDIILNDYPNIQTLGEDQTLCEGATLDLNAITDIGSISWQDGSTSNNFIVNTAGMYWFIADNNGCLSSDTITIEYNSLPDLNLGEDVTLCEGETQLFSSNIIADTYLWQDGSSTADFLVETPGVVWLEVTNNNCSFRDSIAVFYVEGASINLGADTTLCDQEAYLLEVNIPMATFEWNDASTANTLNATTSALYWVEVTSQGCSARDSIQLNFQNNPSIEIEDQIMACQGDLIELNAPAAADSYLWSDGDTDGSFSSTAAGLYTLTTTFGECTVEKDFEIILNTLPNIQSLGADTEICENEQLLLNAQTDAGTISWQDGSTNSTFIVNAPGIYWFIADNNGCTNRDSIQVNFKECSIFKAYIPNVFSPNEDGSNDRFSPQIASDIEVLSYSFNVFNRWGGHVFSTTDINIGWDGKMNGQLLDFGVYIYAIEITFIDDLGQSTEVLKGDVMLMR